MNEELILKMIEPYEVEGSITYKEFDNIFNMLSLHEQYNVVGILIAHGIEIKDAIETDDIEVDDGESDLLDIEPKNEELLNDDLDEGFQIKYDEGIFRDGRSSEYGEGVLQYREIKQSNVILCQLIQRGSIQAQNDLCVKNEKLVRKYAKAYFENFGNDLGFDDLMQMGYIGLLKAAKKFDPNLENAFSTYAVYWIKQSISREIADKGFTIRLPVHVVEKVSKVTRLDNKLYQEGYSYSERITKIAQEIGCSADKVSSYLTLRSQFLSCTSLNTPVGEDGDIEIGELVEDKESIGPEDLCCEKELREKIDVILGTLTSREEKILRLRFGLDDDITHTLEEVGQVYNVTRERIRQIEAKALRKLRHPTRSNKIRDYL